MKMPGPWTAPVVATRVMHPWSGELRLRRDHKICVVLLGKTHDFDIQNAESSSNQAQQITMFYS